MPDEPAPKQAAPPAPAEPPQPPAAPAEVPADLGSADGAPAKILVADDVALMRNLLLRALVKAGYVVFEANDGKQALELVSRERPDLIVLDSMMPVLSGPECLKILKTTPNTKNIPVIMCTARSEKPDVLESKELGADDYIVKPFKIETVLERVAKHLPPEKRGSTRK